MRTLRNLRRRKFAFDCDKRQRLTSISTRRFHRLVTIDHGVSHRFNVTLGKNADQATNLAGC